MRRVCSRFVQAQVLSCFDRQEQVAERMGPGRPRMPRMAPVVFLGVLPLFLRWSGLAVHNFTSVRSAQQGTCPCFKYRMLHRGNGDLGVPSRRQQRSHQPTPQRRWVLKCASPPPGGALACIQLCNQSDWLWLRVVAAVRRVTRGRGPLWQATADIRTLFCRCAAIDQLEGQTLVTPVGAVGQTGLSEVTGAPFALRITFNVTGQPSAMQDRAGKC